MSETLMRVATLAAVQLPAEPAIGDYRAETVQVRHGEVLLRAVEASALPEILVEVEAERDDFALVGANALRDHGTHLVGPAANVRAYRIRGSAEIVYLHVRGFATLRHHDAADPHKHASVVLAPLWWRVTRQRGFVATAAGLLQSRPLVD